ncbi:MAG: hypothetical protein JSW64_13375 [Candidatus Zixiibacteriota bacterium]|nr:MAG: hypothetical protein JSW64_13375 [candidate division Zixibacteria bacterium]
MSIKRYICRKVENIRMLKYEEYIALPKEYQDKLKEKINYFLIFFGFIFVFINSFALRAVLDFTIGVLVKLILVTGIILFLGIRALTMSYLLGDLVKVDFVLGREVEKFFIKNVHRIIILLFCGLYTIYIPVIYINYNISNDNMLDYKIILYYIYCDIIALLLFILIIIYVKYMRIGD